MQNTASGHTDGEPVRENEVAATCETDGSYDEVVYCSVCGAELSRKTVTLPAPGHEDADNDGKCDRCGEKMQGGDHCKWCGRIHDRTTFRGLVTGWLHAFLYSIKPYIVPVLAVALAALVGCLFI